jgi:hypothetical protein
MFLTWKQWAPLHDIASQGMPALQISDLRFKQARKSLKFGTNCGTQASHNTVHLTSHVQLNSVDEAGGWGWSVAEGIAGHFSFEAAFAPAAATADRAFFQDFLFCGRSGAVGSPRAKKLAVEPIFAARRVNYG